MAKKLLALVSALALLVCAVSVFTIVSVSADAVFGMSAADWEERISTAGGAENTVGTSVTENADGSVKLSVGDSGAGRAALITKGSYALAEGVKLFFSNPTGVNHFGIVLVNADGAGETWLEFKDDGDVEQMYPTWAASSSVMGGAKSDVIKAMFADGAKNEVTVKPNGTSGTVTVTNAAGSVDVPIQYCFSNLVGWAAETPSAVKVGFLVWQWASTYEMTLDAYGVYEGNEGPTYAELVAAIKAAEEAARVEAFNTLVEAEKTHYEALMAEWTGCNVSYNNSDRHQMKESDEVGVNVWTKPHSTITVGAQTVSKVKLDGAHLVLDNITTTDPLVIGFSPLAYDEEGGADWGGANPIVTIDLVAGDIRHNPPTTAETILAGSDVVKAMANGVSVVAFDVDENNAVTLTIENAVGVATATMPVVGENPVWADRTEAYLSVTYRCTNDNGASFDIVAFHGGDETCGVDVEEEPDEPTTEEPPVTEEPVEIPDCTTYPSYVPTVDVIKDPDYWDGAFPTAVEVVPADKGVNVSFGGNGNPTFRTYCTQTYNLDGLHISLRNLTGNGFSIAFFSGDADNDYTNTALRIVNHAAGTAGVVKVPWDNGATSQTADLVAFTTDVDLMVKKLDNGDWEYSINGKAMTLSAELVSGLIADTTAVRINFFEMPPMGAHSFDVVALHDGLHADEKAAADKAEADKAAAKAVDDMVANLGEITLESGDAIQAAYDAYAALTDDQKALVAADTLTNWQAAKDAYDALVESQPGTQPTTEPTTEPPVVGPTLNTTEIIAGDAKFYSVSSTDFNGNDSYHNGGNIKWSDKADGGVHCVLNAVGSARLGYNYLEELTLNGTHIVLSGLTATDEFAFILGAAPSAGAGDHPGKSIVQFKADGGLAVHPGATSDAPEVITGSDVIKAFFAGKTTLFAFAVAEDGAVSVTVANDAGEVTGTFSGYGEQWTDHTKAYVAFATNSANGPREFDIVSVHGGDVECGETVNPDEAAVKEVEALIDAIGTVTLESANAIYAAMEAYEALEDAQKAVVSNYDKLMAAALEFTELYFNQYRYEYNIGIRVNSGEITPHCCSFLNAEQFDENRGVLIDQWAPDQSGWAERAGYNFAVPLDGLQIVLKDLSSVKESGNIISIGLMNEAGAWVDAEAMIAFLFMPTPREGGGEYGYLHVESKKNDLAYSACLDQVDFESNIWAADLDQVVIEFAYAPETGYVGVYVNGQFMTVVTMEDLGIADVNAVIPHFGLWGTGVCNYGVYSITSKAQADRVQAAIDAIEALGDIDPSNADDVAKVAAAEEAYKALDKNLRGYVTNYDTLLEAIEKVEGVEPDEPTEDPVETEEPTEAPVETEEPTEEPENPKTGEGFAVLPIALLIAAAGALVISRKRK